MKNATGSQVKTLHRIVDEKVEALEFGITGELSLCGSPAAGPADRKAASWWRASSAAAAASSFPPAMMSCNQGDDVIVVATDTGIQDIRDILQ